MSITKQTIAIIGAGGNMGSAIAKKIVDGNYRLLLFDTEAEKLKELKKNIQHKSPTAEVEIMHCAHDCSWEADIIIMAVPHKTEKKLANAIRGVATQKIVVSISNPSVEEINNLLVESESSMAEKLQQWLPHSKIVKAFNTNLAANFEQPVIDGQQADSFIASNDEEAVQVVAQLVKTVGFNPINAGDLTVSGTLERLSLLLTQLPMQNKQREPLALKILYS